MKAKCLIVGFGAVLAIVGLVNGATITWSSALAPVEGSVGQTLSTGLFDQTRTLMLAENVGGGASTFDGIDFAAGTIFFDGTYGGFTDSSGVQIARDGAYGGSIGTVTLNVVAGQAYRVQALLYDGRSALVGRTSEFDGVDMGQYANSVNGVTWGDGRLMTGTFTADAATQTFTIETFNADTSSAGSQLNAITLYATGVILPSPPVWDNPIVVASGTVGESYSDTLAGKAIDPNGDPITFSLAPSTPDWLGVAADGTLSNIRAIETGDIGTNDFNVVATDGISGSTTGLLQIVIAAPSSVITWTSEIATANATGDLDAGLFNTDGVLVLAENLGGDAVTFDGINFAAGTINLGSTASVHANNDGQINHTSTYNWPNTALVTLDGLIVGREYRIQALVYDGREQFAGRTVSFDGTDLGQVTFGTAGDLGNGLLATGIFVARATTQSFLAELFNPASQGSQLNAITLYEVDFPAGEPVSIQYDGINLSWMGAVNYTYTVETNGNLIAGSWVMYTNNIPGTGSLITITPPTEEDQLFYRVITD